MKLLNSGIVLAIIGAIMSLGTTAGLLYTQREAIFGTQKVALVGTLPLSHLWGFDAQEVDALVAELKTERVKLVERQTDLDRVAAHVEAEKRELETTRAEVAAMRDEISAEIPKVQDSEKKNLKTLAQTYSTMAPTAVVAIFHDMDDSLCVKLLSLMKPAIVGAILQEMSLQDKDDTLTKRAARISDKLRLILSEPKPAA
jgi:flagellar motility protein MotE (MotC chaperone)